MFDSLKLSWLHYGPCQAWHPLQIHDTNDIDRGFTEPSIITVNNTKAHARQENLLLALLFH